jgi:hypothetical protein
VSSSASNDEEEEEDSNSTTAGPHRDDGLVVDLVVDEGDSGLAVKAWDNWNSLSHTAKRKATMPGNAVLRNNVLFMIMMMLMGNSSSNYLWIEKVLHSLIMMRITS